MQITQFSSHGMPCDRRMEDMTMTESRTYLLNNVDIQIVIDELSRFLHTEKGMDVQTAPTPDGYLLQAGQPKDTLRTLSGMRLATTVQFSIVENNLNVTIGEGQWSDKLGAGAVGLFLLWPLAITAGIGAYKQKNLPDEIFHVIGCILQPAAQNMGAGAPFSSGAQTPPQPDMHAAPQTQAPTSGASPIPTPVNEMITCPQCAAKLLAGSNFCNICGTKLNSTCPGCGAPLIPGSKFCSNCGQAL